MISPIYHILLASSCIPFLWSLTLALRPESYGCEARFVASCNAWSWDRQSSSRNGASRSCRRTSRRGFSRDIKADVEEFSAEVMHEISGKCYFWQLTLEKIGDDRRYSEIPKVSSVSSIWALPGTGKHVSGAGWFPLCQLSHATWHRMRPSAYWGDAASVLAIATDRDFEDPSHAGF